MHYLTSLVVSAAIAVGMAAAEHPQTGQGTTGTENRMGQHSGNQTGQWEQFSDADREFMDKVSTINMAEMELGDLASCKGQSGFVQRFGEMMKMEHRAAQVHLDMIADRGDYTLPQNLDTKHKRLKWELKDMYNLQFDRVYRHEMINGHEEALRVLEGYASSGTNDRLKMYANKMIPHVRHHLTMLQEGRIMRMPPMN